MQGKHKSGIRRICYVRSGSGLLVLPKTWLTTNGFHIGDLVRYTITSDGKLLFDNEPVR